MAQSGICLNFEYIKVSHIIRNNLWILDLGATNHITFDLNIFDSYISMNGPKKITIANRDAISIAGHGNVNLNSSLSIHHVFYVLNLSNNLIAVRQLTKDLNSRVVFSPNQCEFQALDTGKKIGVEEEWNGLYYLKTTSSIIKGEKPITAYSFQPAY